MQATTLRLAVSGFRGGARSKPFEGRIASSMGSKCCDQPILIHCITLLRHCVTRLFLGNSDIHDSTLTPQAVLPPSPPPPRGPPPLPSGSPPPAADASATGRCVCKHGMLQYLKPNLEKLSSPSARTELHCTQRHLALTTCGINRPFQTMHD